MTDQPDPTANQDKLASEARDWVMLLTSGEATKADADGLREWRSRSRAHRKAFAEANFLWDALRPAATDSAVRIPVVPLKPAGLQRPVVRRAFLGGAVGTAAAIATYAVVRPPLELWPSLADMTADYRTAAGQQQQITLDNGVQVKLNTRTSVTLLPPDSYQSERVELLAGEALVSAAPRGSRSVVVVAAQGRSIANNARFNVRCDGASVCVTCLDGDVRVEFVEQSSRLRAGQQIVYASGRLGPEIEIDTETVTGWERGVLIFRNDPLSQVIEEVNRYRSGRIIVTNAELGRRLVVATFRIDRLDEVIPRLQTVFGVRIRSLPGGIVLVG